MYEIESQYKQHLGSTIKVSPTIHKKLANLHEERSQGKIPVAEIVALRNLNRATSSFRDESGLEGWFDFYLGWDKLCNRIFNLFFT